MTEQKSFLEEEESNIIDYQKELVESAVRVFQEIVEARDSDIPRSLLEEAFGVAVIPHAVKGAFVLGGEYGRGIVSQRGDDGNWSASSFVTLSGGSVGFQVGAAATDYVLFFTNREGLAPLLEGTVTLGADVTVAAGPVGRTANASTDMTLHAAIYSYSHTKGAFAGVALDGAVLSIDASANKEVYGERYTGKQILVDHAVSSNAITNPFVETIRKHFPAGGPKRTL